jgi:hypothetical protein
VATALLDECEGLRSPCGRLITTSVVVLRRQHRLMTTSVVVLRRQHCLVATALLVECEGLRSPSELGHISLERGHARGELGRLLAGTSSSSLLAGASGSSLLACASGLLVEELLATALVLLAGANGLLVEELSATALVLLAGVSGLLVEELSATALVLLAGASGLLVEELSATALVLLAGVSGLLVEELSATVLILSQAVDGPLPILVGAFRVGTGPMKNGPPKRGRRQQPSGLLVFAECTLVPFLPWMGGTNVGRGVVCLIVGKQPVGCLGGRLRPLDLQPHLRIGEGGRGQMGRW